MSSSRQKRPPYSSLLKEEKDRRNARRRALYAKRAEQRDSSFLVHPTSIGATNKDLTFLPPHHDGHQHSENQDVLHHVPEQSSQNNIADLFPVPITGTSSSERKPSQCSRLSTQEEEKTNAKERAVYTHKAQQEDLLFPVHIACIVSAEENLCSAFPENNDQSRSDNEDVQHDTSEQSNHGLTGELSNVATAGTSSAKPSAIPYSGSFGVKPGRPISGRKDRNYTKKGQQKDSLFPVYVASILGGEKDLCSTFPNHSDGPHNDNGHIINHAIEQNNDDIIGELFDVPIGLMSDNMMPPPRIKLRSIPTEPYRTSIANSCKFCHAKKLQYETDGFCCSRGEVSLYSIEVPSALRQLYSGSDAKSRHFLKYVKPYNEVFSFTSMGVHLDPFYARRTNGIYTFRAQGQIYHFMSPLYPKSNESPACLQLYFYDTENEIFNRKSKRDQLRSDIIATLISILHDNPYSRFFRSLHDLKNLDQYQIVLRSDPLVEYTAMPPTASQVGAIWIEDQDGSTRAPRDIKVYQHNTEAQTISYYFGCYDPLQYPLLFPCGEPGWHRGIKRLKQARKSAFCAGQGKVLPCHFETPAALLSNEKDVEQGSTSEGSTISAREYYAFRLQIRDDEDSLLLHSGRLLQQFVVDIYVKIETSRLDFFRHNQNEIRADLYKGIVDSVHRGESDPSKVGKRIVLPASFIGGPRDMRKRYLDAMALVEKYGKPDIFLTMTCNPNWPEIKQWMASHEEANNRPDLISRVFKSKCTQLEKEVVKKELFGPVAAYTYVIEFQKRGMPHMHMLLILKRPYKISTVDKINAIISAEIPDPDEHPHLYNLVVKHMMHGPCGALNEENVCMQNGSCKNHFPRQFCDQTSIASNGYPLYRRQDNGIKVKVRGQWLDNRWVVPYNAYLLALFDCHINVEICSTVKAVKYLYKYIYKGHDKIMYHIVSINETDIIDEIQQYQLARWISPPEAVWRIYRFPLHQIRPAVISLPLHLEGCHTVPLTNTKDLHEITDNSRYSRTMLTQFFWINRSSPRVKALNLLYKEFPEHFVWDNQARIWSERKSKDVVGRIITANPVEGERYYLRLLLGYIRAPISYEDLRMKDEVLYSSYREAAVVHGLLHDDHSCEKCMQEASMFQMPISLRQLFCTILVHCSPTEPKRLFLRFEEEMTEDYISIQHLSIGDARQLLLRTLGSYLQSMGKDLDDYQLSPLLSTVPSQQMLTKEIEDELSYVISENDLLSVDLLNQEQKAAFNAIMNAVLHSSAKCFFIDGPGGTGKTFLYRALLATLRSQRKIALATATSGVAASILPNGRTAHSRFKIPIDLSENQCCNVNKQSGLAELMKQTSLIIWDEASMAKKDSIEALDYMLQDICEDNRVFGGKVVVLGGDFRQTLPVVPKGTRNDIINASLVRSYLWHSFTKLKLSQNMRAKTDPIFSNYILHIGNGTEPEDNDGNIKLPQTMVINPAAKNGFHQLIEFVFGCFSARAFDHTCLTNSAILTPKNQAVDKINDLMMSRFPGAEQLYLSYDETKDASQQGLYIDFLNSITPAGLPPHKLVLKKGCPVLLMRNINPAQGLCNGTRLICKDFGQHLITAEIAVGERKGSIVFIPRIPLEPHDSYQYPVEFRRRQFPVRPCFAMTINKAQGQTLAAVGIYLPEPVFTHGQLYVALSRAQVKMVLNVVALKDIDLTCKNFTIQAMVIEKEMPKPTTKKNVPCQRLMLQDIEGVKIQAALLGANIEAFEDTLKMYCCYSIMNPVVNRTPESVQFLPHPYQLVINARSPVEEIHISGLTIAAVKHDFIQINDLQQYRNSKESIDIVFAVTEVAQPKVLNDAIVTLVQITDQSLKPILLSMWERFAEYDAKVMNQPKGTFPVIIGLRLKTSQYQGLSLGTKTSTIFMFDSPLPEAVALQLWCDENAAKLKELPSIADMKREKSDIIQSSLQERAKIADLPTTLARPEVFAVEGVIEIIDTTQTFYYLACPICKRATDAYGDDEVWCNNCKQKVNLTPRLKMTVQISDPTGSKEATVFGDVAEALYDISEADIDLANSTLTIAALEKLAKPKTGTFGLKARLYTYRDVAEIRFNIQSLIEDQHCEDPKLLEMHPSSAIEQGNKGMTKDVISPITPAKKASLKRKRPESTSANQPK